LKLKYIAKHSYNYDDITRVSPFNPLISMLPPDSINDAPENPNIMQELPDSVIIEYCSSIIKLNSNDTHHKILYTNEAGKISIYIVSLKRMRSYIGTFDQLMSHQSNRLLAKYFDVGKLNEWFHLLSDNCVHHSNIEKLILKSNLTFELDGKTDYIAIPFDDEEIGNLKMESIKPGLRDELIKANEIHVKTQVEYENMRQKTKRRTRLDKELTYCVLGAFVLNVIAACCLLGLRDELMTYAEAHANLKYEMKAHHVLVVPFIISLINAIWILPFTFYVDEALKSVV